MHVCFKISRIVQEKAVADQRREEEELAECTFRPFVRCSTTGKKSGKIRDVRTGPRRRPLLIMLLANTNAVVRRTVGSPAPLSDEEIMFFPQEQVDLQLQHQSMIRLSML